ncbi:MAG: hypothetical protein HYT42_01470, partial [Candidatus Sungbacteria bacterium]|nr:hypothetical protein [Candidatus Sungbacteria bacterium]
CRDYCEDPANREECFGFAEKQGLITAEDKKNFEVGQKLNKKLEEAGGPGGCRNESDCRTYCSDAARAEECVAFASTHGGIPPEQARAMLRQFTENRFGPPGDFGPAEFGPPGFAGPDEFRRRFEEETQKRFEQFRALEENFRGKQIPGFGPPGGFPSPGGEFGGPPGLGGPGLPGQTGGFPGGGPGGVGFVGPGGCTSPSECIQYCSSNPEECFSGSQPGIASQPGGAGRGETGSRAPGQPSFQLRTNLIQEVKPGELPQGFEQFGAEERERIFREKFEQFRGAPGGFSPPTGGAPGEFPPPAGGAPGEFPGQPPSTFPGGVPQEFPGRPGEFPRLPGGEQRFPGTVPPAFREGGLPIEGGPLPGTPGIFGPLSPREQIQQETERQIQQQVEQQSQQQFQQQFQQQSPGGIIPESGGSTVPQTGTFTQPPPGGETFTPPPSTGSFSAPPPTESFSAPPPSGSFSPPPPSSPPPPQSSLGFQQEVAGLLDALWGFVGIR